MLPPLPWGWYVGNLSGARSKDYSAFLYSMKGKLKPEIGQIDEDKRSQECPVSLLTTDEICK
jgi:hypothetical protein